MPNVQPMVFDDVEPIEIPVSIKGKSYILREASESAAARYKNAQLKAMKRSESADGSSVTNLDGIAETELLLVSVCLFEKTETGEKTVDTNWLKTLPHRVVAPLFQRAEEISGLAKKSKTEEELVKEIKSLQGELVRVRSAKIAGQPIEDADAKN
jgi:hypothetical protein